MTSIDDSHITQSISSVINTDTQPLHATVQHTVETVTVKTETVVSPDNNSTATTESTLHNNTIYTDEIDSISDSSISDIDDNIVLLQTPRRHSTHSDNTNELLNNLLLQEQLEHEQTQKQQSDLEYAAALASTLQPYELLPIEQQYMAEFIPYTIFYIELRNAILAVWHTNVTQYCTFEYVWKHARLSKKYHAVAQRIYQFLDQFGYINTGLLSPNNKPAEIQHIHNQHNTIQPRHIIVIGAGIAGLSAARQLQSFGHTVTILEARDRIGGRICTDTTNFSGAVDLGASIIVGLESNPLTVLCRQLNNIPQMNDNIQSYNNLLSHIGGYCPIYDVNGQILNTDTDTKVEQLHNMLLSGTDYIRRKLNLTTHEVDEDSDIYQTLINHEHIHNLDMLDRDVVSHMSLLQGLNTVQQRLNIDISDYEQSILNWHIANIEYGNATNCNNLSLVHWDSDDTHFLIKGDHTLLRSGFYSIIKHLETDLNIVYNTVVQHIEYSENNVAIHTTNRIDGSNTIYQCNQVLCTVSLGCLKSQMIQFTPSLPQYKRDAINRLGFGLLNKLVLEFDGAFWCEHDMFGSINNSVDLRGMYYMYWNLQPCNGRPILVALAAGTAAHTFETLDKQLLVSDCMQSLRLIYGQDIPNPIKTYCTAWKSDIYAQGTYSYISVDATGDDYDLLQKPIQNTVFFAGEACNRYQPATVPGALISGLRTAGMMENCFKQFNVAFLHDISDQSDIRRQYTTEMQELKQQRIASKQRHALYHDTTAQQKRGFRNLTINPLLQAERQRIIQERFELEKQQQIQSALIRAKLADHAANLLKTGIVTATTNNGTDKLIQLQNVYNRFVKHSGPTENLFSTANSDIKNEFTLDSFDTYYTVTKRAKHTHSDKKHSTKSYQQRKHEHEQRKALRAEKKAKYIAFKLAQKLKHRSNSITSGVELLDKYSDKPMVEIEHKEHSPQEQKHKSHSKPSITQKHNNATSIDTVKQYLATFIKSTFKTHYTHIDDENKKNIFKKVIVKIVEDWNSKYRGSMTVDEWMNDKRQQSIVELIGKYYVKMNGSGDHTNIVQSIT